MLRFFRVNDPYRLLAILVVLVACGIPLLIDPPPITSQELRALVVGESVADGKRMYSQLYDSTAPLAALAFGVVDLMMDRSQTGREILALVFIFFQATFFAIILINNRAYNDNTYLPGLIFGVLCFVSFDFLSVSPELLGSSVLLLAINHIFREVEFRIQRDETILFLGLYLGIASAFVFSYVLFLVAAFVILMVFTRINIRKALLLISGFLLPHTILVISYFYRGQEAMLWKNFYVASLHGGTAGLISVQSLLTLAILPLAYFVFSLFMMTREARFTKYQSQLFQIMFIWLLFSLVEIFLARQVTPHSFITIIPCLTYFLSHYLLLIRRRWIAETMLWIFIIGIPVIGHFARHGRINRIDYSAMFPPSSRYDKMVVNRKVMVLGDDLPLYRQNSLGGYLLDWRLSEETVRQQDVYENVLVLDDQFRLDPPDVIVDEQDLFPTLVTRIPRLANMYRRENNVYWKVN